MLESIFIVTGPSWHYYIAQYLWSNIRGHCGTVSVPIHSTTDLYQFLFTAQLTCTKGWPIDVVIFIYMCIMSATAKGVSMETV